MCALLKKPKYGIQIRMRVLGQDKWMWVHPTNGEPYQWDSADKAREVQNMYYPLTTTDNVRVAPFPEES
jgi:hypothetical protein